MSITNLSASELARAFKEDSVLLIDVREPGEYAAERIHGALLFPLSTFDPHALPDCGKRTVVFQCGSGVRSARAVAACQRAGLPHDTHLRGGIQAWKMSGLPTITVDPATGHTRDRR
ncbi:MAG: rhodanese-like domain-containing protein [Alphaproteobacteria bacterium]|nr:rhodanese-like domain-containing protein [Alphaproteobacteria bacterium]MDE1986982.1 rhodanese-like domain-containing protein [Alphaproteobacteria bacterium]MDE2162986.1 rhodanese-like domain-containing protein [Alphaproteobacteria bacterium]MDE2267369.1 rhodanese-like domain-containing protein [Alphaproteobacteria bacterium]MDE2499735.1 rhodanese-like domain-containing protein [Alphaproteobacteria bacterium]